MIMTNSSMITLQGLRLWRNAQFTVSVGSLAAKDFPLSASVILTRSSMETAPQSITLAWSYGSHG
jgi:hypothetical protein